MTDLIAKKVSRRTFLATVAGLAGTSGILLGLYGRTQSELDRLDSELKAARGLINEVYNRKVASGSGVVQLEYMRATESAGTHADAHAESMTHLRGIFSFDPSFVSFFIETNEDAFVLPTFSLGDLSIDPHSFSVAMLAKVTSSAVFSTTPDGRPQVKVKGEGSCGTAASANAGTRIIGHVHAEGEKEDAKFELTAVDGGEGGGVAGDHLSLTLFFDETSHTNFEIWGPKVTFAGEIASGEITIKEVSRLPV